MKQKIFIHPIVHIIAIMEESGATATVALSMDIETNGLRFIYFCFQTI
jgi:hypothetical protein